MPRRFRDLMRALALMAGAAMAGCTSGPDYARPSLPASPAIEGGRFLRAPVTSGAVAAEPWWQGLNDPALAALIEQGLSRSPTIAAARARVAEARAQARIARAATLPSGGLSAAGAYVDLPDNAAGAWSGSESLFVSGFDARWEIDIWGGARRTGESRGAEAEAAAAQLADAQVLHAAEIARGFIAMRAAQARHTALEQRLVLETRLAGLVEQQVRAGASARQPLEAARAAQSRTRTGLAAISAEVAVLSDTLDVLAGKAPGGDAPAAIGPIPLPPETLAIGDPSGMLARRPDIRAAERLLHARTAEIGAAKARRLPSLSLMGLIGLGGPDGSDLFASSRIGAAALPRLSWNALDFGRSAAAVRGAEAGRDVALAEYEGRVLAALLDAEASLARFGAARTAYAEALNQVNHGEVVARLETQRANAGAASQADALRADISLIDARLAGIEARAALGVSYVALSKALGFGWRSEPTGNSPR
jgi:NodT family efflux transporter outer membrane factor (OMF) lipoprotein